MKKFLVMFVLCSSYSYAYECKLTGSLTSEEQIETSFVTESVEKCRELAEKTGKNNFFGLVEEESTLLETDLSFREEEGIQEDKVIFE